MRASHERQDHVSSGADAEQGSLAPPAADPVAAVGPVGAAAVTRPALVTPAAAAPEAVTLRRIVSLAVPSLVVLAAEPIYVLVDVAVVGHLGQIELAALALGGGVLSITSWLGNVLAYGTTGRAARRYGAGDRAEAVGEGVQASWLAVIVGVAMAVLAQLVAEPATRLLAGEDPLVAAQAAQWWRIAALGIPGILLAMAGNGWLRGVQDVRTPMRYVLAAHLLSLVLCPILVYPAGLGLAGSAIANVAAQLLGGALFVRALVRERASLAPRPAVLRRQLVVNGHLLVRGAAFQACFLSAAAVASRVSTAALGAHQIALQLWFFCALALDAVAVAAQSLVGAALGAGDATVARGVATRVGRIGLVCGIGFAVLIAAGTPVVPALFTPDRAVHAQALVVWPWLVGLLPLGGIAFALDGVLIGAGDVRFLRNLTLVAALGFFLPLTWLAHVAGWGLTGVWAALAAFMLVRLVGLLLRMRGTGWAVAGSPL
jgi:putative MATE family efflux protein